MKKKVFGRKLSRERDSRRALYRSLLKALIERGAIKTTYAKAKSVQFDAEKIVTLVKKEGREAQRAVNKELTNDRKATDALFETVLRRFKGVKSGFTRLTNLPPRLGDNAKMVRLEWSREIVASDNKKTAGKSAIKEKKNPRENILSKAKSRIKESKLGIRKSK